MNTTLRIHTPLSRDLDLCPHCNKPEPPSKTAIFDKPTNCWTTVFGGAESILTPFL